MTCPVCGFTNVEGAIACRACGTSLVTVPQASARPGDAVCAKHAQVPAVAPCDRCGTFYCGVCLQREADGKLYCEACRSRNMALPWDRRPELGMVKAWWETSVLLLKAPQATLQSAQRDASLGSSLLFTLLSTVAGFASTLVIYGLLIGVGVFASATQSEKLGAGLGAAEGAIMLFVLAFYVVGIFAGQIATVLVLGGIEHVVLRLLGERALAGYSVTVRAHALGLAPYVLGLVPFCGPFVMGLWSLVLRCISLASLQRVSSGKAVVAVLSPMFVICFCVLGGYMLFFFTIMNAVMQKM
jgi:hypothetical protein